MCVCVWVCVGVYGCRCVGVDVGVSDYHAITSISFLLCSAALLPVSPASSEPTSGTASPPNLMETAPVNTSGRYQWEMCTSWGAVHVYS